MKNSISFRELLVNLNTYRCSNSFFWYRRILRYSFTKYTSFVICLMIEFGATYGSDGWKD
jgi:hypothetical protein